ncbi:MAG: hypothetical protein PW735_12205 [Acidobacteriaceae bacterium]|nr:hypothetical protein [Acidobacteriaceae bacterium]
MPKLLYSSAALTALLFSSLRLSAQQASPTLLAEALEKAHAPLFQPLAPAATPDAASSSSTDSSLPDAPSEILFPQQPQQPSAPAASPEKSIRGCEGCGVDSHGNAIPLERQQPKRILGFMPNFRSVSAGAAPPPPGWKYNFKVATHQAFDYSSFLFLGLTSITAEGMNSHPVLGKGVDGFWAYTWRGFLDKTDGTYLSAWLLPSLLHEDTRYYPMGSGHSVMMRSLYIISRQGVARTYSGHDTPNIAGLGGKALTQIISRSYYPSGATDFGTLATKFGYSIMRDVGFSAVREFYPDIAAHYVRKHRAKVAAQAAQDAEDAAGTHPSTQQ